MKNRFNILLAILVIITLQTKAQSILFTNVNVFDGTSSELTLNQNVLVEGKLISQIGPNLKAPRKSTVIDGKGMTLMPGLIDTHTHIAVSEQLGTLMNDVDWMYWGVSAAEVTTDWLMRGYTTVRDAAGPSMSLHHRPHWHGVPGRMPSASAKSGRAAQLT